VFNITPQRTRKDARELKPLIAKKDIIVYKMLDLCLVNDRWCFVSPYYGMEYKPNKTYRVERMQKTITNNTWYGLPSWSVNIGRGFHAYRKPLCRTLNRFIIPKGSKYFISADGSEIVSDRIKTPKKLTKR
jgi:hypothetical protein